MKISAEQYGCKYTLEVDYDDLTIDDFKQLLKSLALSMGYHPDNVNEMFGDENEQA